VEWTGKADSTNGAYGIYPVETQNILIEGCDVKGASDAGIYLGQSLYGVIRNNKVHGNVAGIEVENSDYVDLHDNEVFNNTCGIMIFDLPDLKRKNGKFVRVFNNKVYDNNHPNFSSQGIAVYVVPYGVGLVLMAAQNIEVFNNTFTGNNTVGFTLLDLTAADELYGDRARKDTLFDIFPSSMYIYDNKFERNKDSVPDLSRPLGQFLVATLQKNIPDILVMTKYNPKYMEGGKLKPEHSICMKNNQGTVLNIYTKKTNLSEFDCERTKIDPVKIPQL
jgi:parallel beta-helix repeat protein